jgi:hypothetical protein
MATTRFVLTPESAHFPLSNYPALSSLQVGRPILLFDASTEETALWTVIAPQGLSGALTAIVHYICMNAVTGTAAWNVQVEAVSDGDSQGLEYSTSFDTEQTAGTGTVPGTQGYIDTISVSISNDDSLAVADYLRFGVFRDVSADSVANDLALLAVEIREA